MPERLNENGMSCNFACVPFREGGEVMDINQLVARTNELLYQFSVITPSAVFGMTFRQYVVQIEAINKADHPIHCGFLKKRWYPFGDTTKTIPAP